MCVQIVLDQICRFMPVQNLYFADPADYNPSVPASCRQIAIVAGVISVNTLFGLSICALAHHVPAGGPPSLCSPKDESGGCNRFSFDPKKHMPFTNQVIPWDRLDGIFSGDRLSPQSTENKRHSRSGSS